MRLFARSLISFLFLVLFIFLLSPNVSAAELQLGSVWQWSTASASIQKEGLTDIISVSTGLDHSLVLKQDGTVWAWGKNDYGQLGNGTIGGSSVTPVQVKITGGEHLINIVAISASTGKWSMALRNDGTVWAWGNNWYGARGTGVGNNDYSSTLLAATQVKGETSSGFLSQVIAITAGGQHSLTLKSDGSVVGWGNNDYKQAGAAGSVFSSIIRSPKKVTDNAVSIAAGSYHSVVVKADGTVWGWGRTYEGQLGTINGIFGVQAAPVQIPGISGIKNVWAKDSWNVALSADGKIFEWGHRFSPDDRNPRQVPGLDDVAIATIGQSIFSKYTIGAAVKKDGSVWVWDADKNNIPQQVPDLSNIGSISVGGFVPNLAVVKVPDSTPTPTPTPTPVPKTPLILIPGIGGSELKTTETTIWDQPDGHGGVFSHVYPEEKIWVNNFQAGLPGEDDYFDVLRMFDDGQTSQANLALTGNLFDGYQDTITFFTSNGYTLNKDFFVFPYDWRRDVSSTATPLDQKIESIKTQTGSPKVDIIAHSMGGLVARNYINDSSKASNVRKLFTVGTPHLGSVEFLKAMRYGICLKFEIGSTCFSVNPSEVKDVLQNMISGFQLAPSQEYFNFYDGEDKDHLRPYRVNGQSFDYNQIKSFLTNLGHNTSLFGPSESFHILDNDLANINGVEIINIAGSGLPTLGQIIEKSVKDFFGNIIQEKDGFTINGDKTVPLFSASLIDSSQNKSLLGNAKVFYTKQEHGGLVVSGPALELIKNILNNDSQLPGGVSTTPYSFSGTKISVHSPVNMHVYDADGNHTGPTSNGDFEANIPGSSYDTLDDAKFIWLPDDGQYDIKFEATDQGSFDFKIRKYENDENTQTVLYSDTPLTNETKAETTFDTSGEPPTLLVDEDGNGTTDFEVDSSSVLTGDAIFDQTPPETTIELSGTEGLNGWYKSDVVVTLNSQDEEDGSGILKTEYSLDNGVTVNIYTEPFIIATEEINKLKFRSIDNAGNEENPQETEIKIDKTPPQVTIDANPKILWPANNKMVDVRITGSSSDANLLSTKITVSDEYHQIEPTITTFGQIIKLQASRNGNDKDGRKYTIKVIAEDLAGNISQALVDVVVPHDQRK